MILSCKRIGNFQNKKDTRIGSSNYQSKMYRSTRTVNILVISYGAVCCFWNVKIEAVVACTCCSQRMPNCHRTSIDIDLLWIKPQLVTAIYKLGSKSLSIYKSLKLAHEQMERKKENKTSLLVKYLIYFKKINIIKFKTCSLHSNWNCSSWADTHDGRINTNSNESPTPPQSV